MPVLCFVQFDVWLGDHHQGVGLAVGRQPSDTEVLVCLHAMDDDSALPFLLVRRFEAESDQQKILRILVLRGLVERTTFSEPVDGLVGSEQCDARVRAGCAGAAGAMCQHLVAFGRRDVFEANVLTVPEANALGLKAPR